VRRFSGGSRFFPTAKIKEREDVGPSEADRRQRPHSRPTQGEIGNEPRRIGRDQVVRQGLVLRPAGGFELVEVLGLFCDAIGAFLIEELPFFS
jgi:hypothetical protein